MSETYCLRCKKQTGDVNPHRVTTARGQTRIASKCAVCGTNKSRMVAVYANVARAPRKKRSMKKGGFLGDLIGSIF